MVKNVFILDEHLKTDKVLTVNGKNAFFDDLYTLDLSTGTETYEFSTTITEINESNYVMFYYHGKYKLFQIIEIEQEHDNGDIITTVYAETACLELLNNVVRTNNFDFIKQIIFFYIFPIIIKCYFIFRTCFRRFRMGYRRIQQFFS